MAPRTTTRTVPRNSREGSIRRCDAEDNRNARRNVGKYSLRDSTPKPIQRLAVYDVLALALFFSVAFRRKLVCIQHNLRVCPTSVAESNLGLSLPRMTGHNFIPIISH
jgi:hypothetical protein